MPPCSPSVYWCYRSVVETMRNITLLMFIALLAGCGGATATNGTNGANGASEQIAHSTNCNAFDSGSGTGIAFQYNSATLTSGDRQVSCSVAIGAAQSSYTNYYKSTAPGATSGGCSVTFGFGAADLGFWTFDDTGGTLQVRYTDSGSAHNGYSFVFPGADCSVN